MLKLILVWIALSMDHAAGPPKETTPSSIPSSAYDVRIRALACTTREDAIHLAEAMLKYEASLVRMFYLDPLLSRNRCFRTKVQVSVQKLSRCFARSCRYFLVYTKYGWVFAVRMGFSE